MIVVDSSALLAVLLREPEKQAFQQLISAAHDFRATDVQGP
jgi:uncharacterized protein with PIN domain